jgi:hypothetical protein
VVVEMGGVPDSRFAAAHYSNAIGIAWVMTDEYENAIAAFKRSIVDYKGAFGNIDFFIRHTVKA